MKFIKYTVLLFSILLFLALANTSDGNNELKEHFDHSNCNHDSEQIVETEDHSGHDHGKEEIKEDEDHSGHDHGKEEIKEDEDHSGHDHGKEEVKEEGGVKLTKEQEKEINLKFETAKYKKMDIFLTLPGEVKLNEDKLVHIVPRVSGIVRDVKIKLGQKVKKGDLLAVISSRELADLKANYFISREKVKLVEKTYNRENELREKKISSEQEFLEAENILSEARIEFWGVRQKLRAMGLDIRVLETQATLKDYDLVTYELLSPVSGIIINKHIVKGELVRNDTEVLTIADLNTTWIDLNVYQKDMTKIKKGQKVMIINDDVKIAGGIDYVGPNIDSETRTLLARVILDNREKKLIPGLFVKGRITIDSLDNKIFVPGSALQNIEGKNALFLKTSNGFKIQEIKIGVKHGDNVEIVKGLNPGDVYVISGGFELKSQIVTSTMDSHAGHGH